MLLSSPHEIKAVKGNRVTFEDPRHARKTMIAEKRSKSNLTQSEKLDIIIEQQQLIIEMLEGLQAK